MTPPSLRCSKPGHRAFRKMTICGTGTFKPSFLPGVSEPEQRAIVARLDSLRGKLGELQRLQREVAAELASFTPALLAKALRGEL